VSTVLRVIGIVLVLELLPSLGLAQSTDRSEMDAWLRMTRDQKDIPIGTTITKANWQQYQDVMPLGMIKLFEGQYGWKIGVDPIS
jgi:hypothetical protein